MSQQTPEPDDPQNWGDPVEWSHNMVAIAERSQRLVQDFLQRQAKDTESPFGHGDPMHIGHTFLEMTQAMMRNPSAVLQANLNLWWNYRLTACCYFFPSILMKYLCLGNRSVIHPV